MQLVDQTGAQILSNGCYAAAKADIQSARCSGRLLERCLNASGNKAKLGASGHSERRAWIMRQHEDRRVIGRLIAPPAFPALVRPRATNWAEHVAPQDPGANLGEALLRHCVVNSCLAIAITVQSLKCSCGEKPLHQFGSPDAERILEILVRSGTVAINGNRETLDA